MSAGFLDDGASGAGANSACASASTWTDADAPEFGIGSAPDVSILSFKNNNIVIVVFLFLYFFNIPSKSALFLSLIFILYCLLFIRLDRSCNDFIDLSDNFIISSLSISCTFELYNLFLNLIKILLILSGIVPPFWRRLCSFTTVFLRGGWPIILVRLCFNLFNMRRNILICSISLSWLRINRFLYLSDTFGSSKTFGVTLSSDLLSDLLSDFSSDFSTDFSSDDESEELLSNISREIIIFWLLTTEYFCSDSFVFLLCTAFSVVCLTTSLASFNTFSASSLDFLASLAASLDFLASLAAFSAACSASFLAFIETRESFSASSINFFIVSFVSCADSNSRLASWKTCSIWFTCFLTSDSDNAAFSAALLICSPSSILILFISPSDESINSFITE